MLALIIAWFQCRAEREWRAPEPAYLIESQPRALHVGQIWLKICWYPLCHGLACPSEALRLSPKHFDEVFNFSPRLLRIWSTGWWKAHFWLISIWIQRIHVDTILFEISSAFSISTSDAGL